MEVSANSHTIVLHELQMDLRVESAGPRGRGLDGRDDVVPISRDIVYPVS